MATELMANNSDEQNFIDLEFLVTTNNTVHESPPSSELTSLVLVLNLSLAIPYMYLDFLIHRMVSREQRKVGETLHGRALAIYAKFMVFAYFWFTINVNGILSYTYPASEVLGSWYCYMVEIVHFGIVAYLGSFSLLIAAMKYWFIVHNAKAKKVGIERSLAIFITIHLSMCIVLPLLNVVSNGDVGLSYWVNKCWGNEVRNADLTISFGKKLGEMFCYFRVYQLDYYIGKRASEYLEPCLRVLCGGLAFFMMLILSNLIELILYVLVLRHMDRYV